MNQLLTVDSSIQDLAVGLVEAQGMTFEPSGSELLQQCQVEVESVQAAGPEGGDDRRRAVRRLLRQGGFKPSGRNKPAQEYLLRAAGPEGEWPAINNAVDVLNVVSLRSGLPISLIALSRLQTPLVIRYGLAEESFVFNQAGQTLNVEGLMSICQTVAGATQPIGTPVKDSQLAKVTLSDTHVLACVYAPRSSVAPQQLQCWTNALADRFTRWCAPSSVDTWLLPACW